MVRVFKLWALGWGIAVTGATAFHLTPAELTIILSVIGAVVPLGVSFFGAQRGRYRNINAEDDLAECRATVRVKDLEIRRLRRKLRDAIISNETNPSAHNPD